MKLPEHIEDEIQRLDDEAESLGDGLCDEDCKNFGHSDMRHNLERIARMVAEDCAWTARDMIEEGNEGGVVEILRERYGLKEPTDD